MTHSNTEIRKLLAEITPGPWNVQGDGQIWCADHPIVEKLCSGPWGDVGIDFLTGEETLVHWWGSVATDEAKANARLIAAAPTIIAEQADEIARLREALELVEPALVAARATLPRTEDRTAEAIDALCDVVKSALAKARALKGGSDEG